MNIVEAIQAGDLDTLKQLLAENPGLVHASVHGFRTPLHVATDWPGHFPNNVATVLALIEAGADVNAHASTGIHQETPLHWAASSDHVEVLDALLDHGANIEAPGSVIDGGAALSDAVAFGQWNAARRLVERGAKTTLWQAAALGLMPRVSEYFATTQPSARDITNALWNACHGGQREAAEYLLDRGADPHWIGHGHLTPIDAATRSGANDLVEWIAAR